MALSTVVGQAQEPPPGGQRDPHILRNPGNIEENPKFVSAPTLGQPIYACSSAITVKNFITGAKIEVFIDGAPAPNPSFAGNFPNPGQTFDTGAVFTAGQVVSVRQTFGAGTSNKSNSVPVTSHTADFPNGLPKPRLFKHPLFQCGHAVLAEDVVPGSQVSIASEDDAGGGGFKPPVDVGQFQASTEWGLNWTGVSPDFKLNARISASAKLCTDSSPRSDFEITVPPPTPVPPGSIAPPVIDGQQLATVWGATGPPNDLPQHGALVTVRDSASVTRAKTPVPGGVPHTLGLSPNASAGEVFNVTQTLCKESKPGPPVTVGKCSAMPAPVIRPPVPGDTVVHVVTQLPGAEILVFANGQEIGHSSGSDINLSRALKDGETVIVEQRVGKCTGQLVYDIKVECGLGGALGACSGEWPTFRQNGQRTAHQSLSSPLSDPYAVKTLTVKARTTAPDGGVFTASPVIFGKLLYIGSSEGHVYAFDATFGDGAAPVWQYPPNNEAPLTSQFTCNPSSQGVAASVTVAQDREKRTLVIVGAPDRGRPDDPGGRFGAGLGSGRLFAINANNGALVWKTREEIARLTGTTSGSTTEFHEQIGYSAPLVLGDRIYVGIGDHCDNPIQNGRVKAIDLTTGAMVPGFSYASTNARGGGVWTFLSGGLGNGLVTTTGNVRAGTTSEPSVNNALSMVRLNPSTGAVQGKIQPVPYVSDSDPDWAAGAALMATSCGAISASTMKDGFAYGGNFNPSLTFRWQYPNVSYPFPAMGDPLSHGDIRYHRAGAAWNDAYASMSGGQQLLDPSDPIRSYHGYRLLHSFNVCAGEANRVRWIAHLEGFTNPVSNMHDWGLGPPSVTNGIYYVGTNQGFLLALADPSVWPAQAAQCTLPTLSTADCSAAGYSNVPNPTVLKSINLGGQVVRGEPALAHGMVYVANSQKQLFRIAPEKP